MLPDKAWKSSVLVARLDRIDLTPQHIEAIIEYLIEIFPEVKMGATAEQEKVFYDEHFHSNKFEEHLEKLKASKIAAGEKDWVDVVPFRVPRTEITTN